MDLCKIEVGSPADRPESILLALQGILRASGSDADYDDLAATLGVSIMFTAVEGRDPGDWPGYGRDAFLEEAASAMGLRFRNLHPPDAAVGLQRSAEFAQHFEASYVPLIAAGLANGEPALAWMGWGEPVADHWGVLTRRRERDGTLFGVVPFAGEGERELAGPACQVYILEAKSAAAAAMTPSVDVVLARAGAILNNRLASSMGILTGPPAFDAWAKAVDTVADGEALWPGHRRNVRHLLAGRSSAIRFLNRTGGEEAKEVVALLERQFEVLAPFADADGFSPLLSTPAGRMRFANAIRRWGDIETELAKTFPG
jgi:hypothetical protein